MKNRVLIWFSISFFAFLFVVITYISRQGIACPLEELTGIYCFLCGCTRCVWSILDFNFTNAYNYNPWFFLLLPYFILKYIEVSYNFIKHNKFEITNDMRFIIITAIVFMFWRNTGLQFLQP